MVYGIVMYDFKAERADELEAKAGEAIIVIAQSNPEWFVAKPIGRLGGPGLIPVSFVEIRDMATNTPVPDPQGAVKRAGIPKVEEWKKMAADYKNSSITLGKFEGGAGPQSVEQGLSRMSLQQQQQQQGTPQPQTNGGNYVCYEKDLLMKLYPLTNTAQANPTTNTIQRATDRTATASTARTIRQQDYLATIRPNICSDSSILLRRGEILVRHRGATGRRKPLGA